MARKTSGKLVLKSENYKLSGPKRGEAYFNI